MNKPFARLLAIFISALTVTACSTIAAAPETTPPPPAILHVLADVSFRPALNKMKSHFTDSTGFDVKITYGPSGRLSEKILDGFAADVFFPADEPSLDRLRDKGLLDVALLKNILVQIHPDADPTYLAAAVLTGSVNRLQAMAFIDFLASEPARIVFSAHGLTPP